MRHVVVITVALLLAGSFCGRSLRAQKPPSAREAEKLIAEFLEHDGRTDAGQARRLELLEMLRRMSPLRDDREAEGWKKKIEKLWRKGKQLDRSGDNWFWGDERKREPERGRYIVGGDSRKPKGLLITMHGGGAGAGDAGGAFSGYQPAASRFGWVVIAPEVLEKTEHGWTDSGSEEFVLDLVDAALRTWAIPADHVYFAGHSMGGYGSWMLGAHHADRVAAIAPSAGAPTPIMERTPDGPKFVDIIEGVIPNLRNVFVSAYQSLDDPQVPPEPNQVAVEKLAEAQERWGAFEHDYWEVDGLGHRPPPGGHMAQLDKIAERVRITIPERIVWQPTLPWKRRFYWLAWDKPVANAVLVADLDRDANVVRITCDKSTDGLWVMLDSRVLDIDKEVAVIVNDAEVFRGMVTRELANLVMTSEHPDPGRQFLARAPAFQ